MEEEIEERSPWTGEGRRRKRSKESHELPQGLTPRPYQPGSSTVLFIALNRAPTVRGRRAIVPPRTPLSPVPLSYALFPPRSLRRATTVPQFTEI